MRLLFKLVDSLYKEPNALGLGKRALVFGVCSVCPLTFLVYSIVLGSFVAPTKAKKLNPKKIKDHNSLNFQSP
jgi:hypothetical protein